MITGGHDGRIIVWDVTRGIVLHKHLNRVMKRFAGNPDVAGGRMGALGEQVDDAHDWLDEADREEQEIFDIYDAKVSPLGNMIAATDSAGHLVLLAYGDSDAYSKTPDEQFFHNDYQGLLFFCLKPVQ